MLPMHGFDLFDFVDENTSTILDWKTSVAGLTLIGNTHHSKIQNGVTMVKMARAPLVSGTKRYPILKSMTEANWKHLMSGKISSRVGNRCSFHFMTVLSYQKYRMSLIVPFFFGPLSILVPIFWFWSLWHTVCVVLRCCNVFNLLLAWNHQLTQWIRICLSITTCVLFPKVKK